jgi:hypothetical protein
LKLRIIKLFKENSDMGKHNSLEKITKGHLRLWRCPLDSLKSITQRIKEELKTISDGKNTVEGGLSSAIVMEDYA